MDSPFLNQPAHLLALQPDVHPAKYVLDNDVCTLGRSATCQVIILNRKLVSRLHAKIERDGVRYTLYDTNSANGTFVNGHRLREPRLLEDGDQIGLGNAVALLRFNDPDATERVSTRLRYDELSRRFFLDQQPLDLSPSEFQLLHYLYQHIGDICAYPYCAEAIWSQQPYDHQHDSNRLEQVVTTLRSKFRRIAPEVNLIKTYRGVGYELVL